MFSKCNPTIKTLWFLILLVTVFPSSALSESMVLSYFQTDHRYAYRIDLLKLAMENTVETDGGYILQPVRQQMTQSRGLSFLEEGSVISIVFLATSAERESLFLPVKTPILKGLLGYRVCLIRKENILGFSSIESLDQLTSEYVAGFGNQWADMEILRANNIPVVGVAKYLSLFKMLSGNRFDYFPRGINEAWNELSIQQKIYPNLVVDQHIALYYPYPVYFFVNKSNTELADRIQRGLNIALKDGTFKTLFLNYHQNIIQQANLKNRKLFKLINPTLSPNTPEPDTEWWLKE